ncbi:hypothetical protein DL766_004561 [Monosporascus sp. MC13-8B]|uniref:PHD and RING finger domain-containing protein n=1 Tax=Monosporascus cannonballus TaxID=155416 RepID=A0ABY0GWL9_9PEZI|nr:hypothetical protein DL762_008377 [Monosporascus cannonballus]RYP31041.1 hypothetical protein DL766_004561 [Monosporascus sp. MC13-8B]
MADQCIVCLENLEAEPSPPSTLQLPPAAPSSDLDGLHSETSTSDKAGNTTPSPAQSRPGDTASNNEDLDADPTAHEHHRIAVINACGHMLHDACLREWTGKANSCPICRQAFHLVHVYDKVGGVQISSYDVQDKKQVTEFDPQAWLDENPEEEEEARPCPICSRSDHEEVLLLCDSCDATYHTYCVGLDSVPRGHWFCMECSETAAELLEAELDDPDGEPTGRLAGFIDHRSPYLPRTQATMRRARRRARSDEWQGAWGQIAGRVWDALNIDLDGHDDDEALQNYRRSQQRRERERREYQRWQQRLSIASRLGARDVFANNLPNVLPQPVAQQPPPTPQETPEERQAWGALEKAMDAATPNRSGSSHRKRKSRSITASPVEPSQPERKLKRPRTRRVPTQSEASSSKSPAIQVNGPPQNGSSSSHTNLTSNGQSEEAPTFLSSLLREVEMSPSSDDENIRALFGPCRGGPDPSSPVASPSPSARSSPRALSTTPPPRGINDRPGSPLSLTSRIEPIYPPANYSPTRNGADHSDSEQKGRPQRNAPAVRTLEIRQPRPRRQDAVNVSVNLARSQETSPTRALPFEIKESVSGIVKNALKPHWKSGHITADQYASINRDVSHKLYEEVSDAALSDDVRHRCEEIATAEVAKAITDLGT